MYYRPFQSNDLYIFAPQEDITTYELALCLMVMYMRGGGGDFEKVKRHFKQIRGRDVNSRDD